MTRTRLLIVSLLTLVAAAVAVPSTNAAPTCTIAWDGGAGSDSWTSAGNWDLDRLPTTDDHVCLGSALPGTVTISSDAGAKTIQGSMTLRLTGGTLHVTDPTGDALLARYEQTGGTLAGNGTLRVTDAALSGGWQVHGGLLQADGDTRIRGSLNFDLGRRLQTFDATWESGGLRARNSVVWTVTGTLKADSEAESMWFEHWSGSTMPQIRVLPGAALRKTAGAGTATIGWAIDNEGLVSADSGRLRITGGAYENAGHFQSPGDAEVEFGSPGTFSMNGGTYDDLEFTGGRLDVPAGGLFTGADLKVYGGTVGGADGGVIESTGTMELGGGTWLEGGALLRSTGFTKVTGNLNFQPDRKIEVFDGEWTAGSVRGRNRARWTVKGTFDMRSQDGDFWFEHWTGSGPATIHNLGTIIRSSGDGASTVNWAIENDGKIDAQAGRLRFTGGGGESNGDFSSTLPGRTVLGGGDFVLGDNAARPSGGFEVSGGRVNVVDGVTHRTGDLWQSGGTIGGTGTLESSGTWEWSGGWQDGSGLTRSTGFTRIEGNVSLDLDRRVQTHDGAWVSGTIRGRNRATWTNTGTFDMRSESGDAYLEHWSGSGPAVLRNTGTIIRTDGAGDADQTNMGFAIDNDGKVEAKAGRLRFTNGGGESTGDFSSTGTGRAVLAGGDFTIGSGSFGGFEVSGGTVTIAEGALYKGGDLWQSGGTINGPGTLETGGAFTWTGGWMGGSGLTRSTGTTVIDGNVSMDTDRRLQTHDGVWKTGTIRARNRTVWTNTGTFDMRATADAYLEHWSGGGGSTLHNTGTLLKTQGDGNTNVSLAVDNDGTIRASAGRLRLLGGGGRSDGAFESVAPGRTVMGGGAHTVGDGGFDGLEVSGGTLAVEAGRTFAGKDLFQSGGTMGGDGDIVSSGTFEWSGGWAGMGTGLTKSTGTTNVTGHVGIDLDHDVQSHDGTWSGGSMRWRNRTSWLITGDFAMNSETGDAYFEQWSGGGGTSLRSTGTLRKAAGDANTNVYLPLENDGTIRTTSGRLRFLSGGSGQSDGAFEGVGSARTVIAGGDLVVGDGTFDGLEVSGGSLAVADGATFTGKDLFQTGGTLGGAGDILASGTFDWSGGWAGAGGGLTKVAGVTRITGHVGVDMDHDIETAGGTWSAGSIRMRNRTSWVNTGPLAMNSESGDLYFEHWSGSGGATFRNTGTITRADTAEIEGPDDLGIYMPVENDGSMTSQSGRLRLMSGGMNQSTGTFGVDLSGGTFEFGTGATFAAGARILSATVRLADGADVEMPGGEIAGTIEGDGDIRVPSGELRWTGGTIRGAGLLHVAEGASLVLEGATGKGLAGRRLLQNEGDMRHSGGQLYVYEGATLLNEGTLEVASETGDITTSGAGSSSHPAFVNTGTIVKKAGTGSTGLHYLDNRGVLDVRTGRIYSAYFRQTARGRVLATLAGTARGTEHGGLDVVYPRGLAGKVAVRLADGYTPADGATFQIVDAGDQQVGTFTAENLALAGGGALEAEVDAGNMILYRTKMPPAPPVQTAAAAEPEAEVSPAPARTDAAPAATDVSVRLAPGAATAIAVPEGLTVQVLTPTKRASVRFDRKARKLRVKLRRGARGQQLKLRYRVVAADGRRSRVATLTVRIARARR